MAGAALVGGLVSAAFAYGTQVADQMKSGKSFEASLIPYDGKAIAIAAAGGAVAGATVIFAGGLLGGLAIGSVGTAIVAGVAGNAVAGQYESVLGATIEQIENVKQGEDLDAQEFMNSATDAGFLQTDVVIFDGVVGGISGGLVRTGLNRFLGPSLHPSITPRPSHIELARLNGYYVGATASFIRRGTDMAAEAFLRTTRKRADPYILPE